MRCLRHRFLLPRPGVRHLSQTDKMVKAVYQVEPEPSLASTKSFL
jgi:hypothetical protein